MPGQFWTAPLVTQQADGTALNTSVVATSILNAAARMPLPPGPLFWWIGKRIGLRARGRMSNIVTTPGTLTLDFRLGPTSNIIVWNGGAMQLNAVAKVNLPWALDLELTCRSIGNGVLATLVGMGRFQSECVVGSPLPAAGGSGSFLLPVTNPAAGTGFDSTVQSIADLFATFSISNAGNGIQTTEYELIEKN